MTYLRVEIEGDEEEVVWVLRQIGDQVRGATAGGGAELIGSPVSSDGDVPLVTVAQGLMESHGQAPGQWTETLAGDFLAELDATARRMALHVWRAGAVGIHRSVLSQRMELMPVELRSLLVRMSHAMRRFQRDRGLTLSRPVAANSPLQGYFVDPDFAAVAASWMFAERIPDQLGAVEGRS